ncbi:hypothetical protein GEMRC1_011189 [Eukaryota sp. GEM-RC1]
MEENNFPLNNSSISRPTPMIIMDSSSDESFDPSEMSESFMFDEATEKSESVMFDEDTEKSESILFDEDIEKFTNIIALAVLQQDEAEDDFVYKIFNNRDEVFRFAKLSVTNSVNHRTEGIDFDSIPETLMSTVGFCGPQEELMNFLAENSPEFYQYIKSESPPTGLYLLLEHHRLTFVLWPGDLSFSPHTSPLLTFFRLLLEFCSDVFFILSGSIASQLSTSNRRVRAAGRTFKPKTREVTLDDLQKISSQTLEMRSFNSEAHYYLSPVGTKFGVMRMCKESNRPFEQEIDIFRLASLLDQSRVSFKSLSDDDFRTIFKEIRKSQTNSYYKTHFQLKQLLDKYFDSKTLLESELRDYQNRLKQQITDKGNPKARLLKEFGELVKELNALRKSQIGVSFDNTCPICIHSPCDHRFICCRNGICSGCAEVFGNGGKCPFCRTAIAAGQGIEPGTSRHEEQHEKSKVNNSRTIQDLISAVLNPSDVTDESSLKSQILREALNESNVKTRRDCIEEVRECSDKKFKISKILRDTFAGLLFKTIPSEAPTDRQKQSQYREFTEFVLVKEAQRPVIYKKVLEATIEKMVTRHSQLKPVQNSKFEEEISQKKEELFRNFRNDVEELCCSDESKRLFACKELRNPWYQSRFTTPRLICETTVANPGNSLTFSQFPPSLFDGSSQSRLISDSDLVSKKFLSNVNLNHKVIGFFTDEQFVLLILSTNTKTEIRLLKAHQSVHSRDGLPKEYPKRTVLADFDPVSKTLVLYWMENSNHSISTFTIDPSTNNFLKPLRTFNLSSSGRYDEHLLQSGEPVLLKLALYSEGTKAVVLDKSNHFVFIDLKFEKMSHKAIPLPQEIERDSLWIRSVKSNLLLMIYRKSGCWKLSCNFLSTSGRNDISLLQPLKEELPLSLTSPSPSFQLYETKHNYKLLILDDLQLTCIDLLISLQSSSLYLHHEDDCKVDPRNTPTSNSVLDLITKTIKKFALRQSSDFLPSVVNHHDFTVVAPNNHSTITKILSESVNKLKTDGFIFNPFNVHVTSTYSPPKSTSTLNVRDFILRWIESIPIQVARIDAGVFLPLQDGHDSSQWLQMEQVNGVTAQQIAKQLRFGVFELIFSSFSNLPVSVIVCAGSQSSGKSSFLNHIFNHFFDVSGARTTQGVWFGVRVFSDRIWIAIDLEGLGSFERTAQEDCYQSLFGAALAQCFILRTTHHFDRFIQNCLNSWSEAAVVLASGDDLFKGTLIMTPRDVSDEAAGEVIDDFTNHLEPIWDSSLRDNNGQQRHALSIFPTTRVIPWPSYASFPEYSEEIGFLLEDVAKDEPRFESISEFHQIATLLLAKLYVQDFSSLSETALRQRIEEVESSLHDVIATGMIGPLEAVSIHDTSNALLDQWLTDGQTDDDYPSKSSLMLAQPINEEQKNRLSQSITVNNSNCIELANFPDIGLFLDVPNSLQSIKNECHQLIFWRLASYFTEHVLVQCQRSDKLLFDSFLTAVLVRRKDSIIQWFKAKSSGHASESVFVRLGNDIQTKLDTLAAKFSLCRGRCHQQNPSQSMSCNLECSLLANHPGDCSCLGNHACAGVCSLCPDQQCSLGAGHESECLCPAGHMCGQECSLSSTLGCSVACTKQINHEGACLCSTPYEAHLCGHECSLDGCSDLCQEPHHLHHERHHCGAKGCPEKCPLCLRMCASTDHFHSLESDQHLCGNEHNCPQQCSKRGNCEVLTHLRQQEEVYVTSTGDQITYKLFSEQNAVKKNCGVSIGQQCTSHEGSCDCVADSHYCDVKCDSCGYFCMLPIDHEGPHSATHGNMRNLRLVSSAQQVKVGSIGTFGRGDSGIALTCTHSCREFGRGHIHLVPVDHPKLDRIPDSAKRPQSVTYEKNCDFSEVTCVAYWEYILEFDPNFQSSDIELFNKCPSKCGADHDSDVFCELEIFHNPYQGELPSSLPNGYISRDGHVFPCSHYEGGRFHTFLIWDNSGSMGFIEAIYHYTSKRVQQNPSDLFSFINFNSTASLIASSVSFSGSPQSQLQSLLGNQCPTGGTSFYKGFELVIKTCREKLTSKHKPIFIFLSDGWDGNEHTRTKELIRQQIDSFPDTVIHTIGFGDDAGHAWLKRLHH